MKPLTRAYALCVAAAALAVAAGPASGGLTLVTNDASLKTILYNQYGGGVGGISGTINSVFSYTNGVTLTRVQDFSGPTNLAAGTAVLPVPIAGELDVAAPYAGTQDDQTWLGGVDVTVFARYRSANHDQKFGYSTGAAGWPVGTSFTQIVALNNGVNSPPGAVGPITLPAALRWVRSDTDAVSLIRPGAGWEHSSLNADNVDGRDHMITFYISDPHGAVLPTGITGGWLLAFEDLNSTDPNPDYDYNDLVAQVTSDEARLPEPATLSILGVGVLAVLGRRARLLR